jgi:hypothetical protein
VIDEVIAIAIDLAADAVVRIVDPHPVTLFMQALSGKGEEG